MRDALADKYIRGRGIEIGGLHCPLKVPHGAKVLYVDRLPPGEAHPDVRHLVKVHDLIIDDAEELRNFGSASLDFVIANHVFEHCHDAIGTMKTWMRVLRLGGIIYAAVPDKDHTFDRPRALTTLSHLISDHERGPYGSDAEHYREWLSIIDKLSGTELEERVKRCVAECANIHFHTFTLQSMRELLDYFVMQVFPGQMTVLECAVNGAEVIWVLKKA